MPERRPTPLRVLETLAFEAGAAEDDPVLQEARAVLAAGGETAGPLWDALAAALAWAESLEDPA